jgi:hypothetical protein
MKIIKSIALFLIILLIIIGALRLSYLVSQSVIETHRQFVYCKLIKKGMSYDEVNKILTLVGPYHETNYSVSMDNLIRKRIDFDDKFLSFLTGGPTIIGYDNNNNKLVTRYFNTSLSDRFYICKEDIPK